MTPHIPPTYSEDQRKYFEFLQAVITRLANNSFLLKGWTVALVTAIVGLDAAAQAKSVIWLAILPIVLFSAMDAYFLMQERAYRELFKKVVLGAHDLYAFQPENVKMGHWFSALRSPSVGMFHGVLGALTVVLGFIVSG